MYRTLLCFVEAGLRRQVSATGLGAFRIAYGLVAVQEILFLFYFRHLIFDPVPYYDRASPILHVFLLAWLYVAACLAVGHRTRKMAFVNYCFWVVFVVFTPLWQDFDGGFDQLMTGTGFLLIFLPSERALSVDRLRLKLKHSRPGRPYDPPRTVPVLAYTLPLALAMGLVYLDSGLHKLSAPFWRNGMGSWLPATMPYYESPIDMSPLLNLEELERVIGYSIMAFQLGFLVLMWFRPFRIPLLLLGSAFHIGIILSLNVYPFGFAMLAHYLLLVPFHWWRAFRDHFKRTSPVLTVFYDQDCPLCNRTALTVKHVDIFDGVDFKGLQAHARNEPALTGIPESTLLTDLYAVDGQGRVTKGLDTYIRILRAMRYTVPLAFLMGLPGLYWIAARVYRKIADSRQRLVCGETACSTPPAPAIEDERPFPGLFARYAGDESQAARRITKFLVLVGILQLNSTIHYGVLYRWAATRPTDPALALLDQASDSLINFSHAFLGISPHALYMHDHFEGYERILALAYRDKNNQEQWLPFVNEEGRLLTPYWGRIQSMWANVAITKRISPDRLEKFMKKVTAYFAAEMGIDLADAKFTIKLKQVRVPMDWEPDIRHRNAAAPWRDVGTVVWTRDGMTLDLTAPDAVFPPPNARAAGDRSGAGSAPAPLPFPNQ